MIILRNKEFSSMSKKTFEEKEAKIKKKYKTGIGHGAAAAINAAMATGLGKNAIKTKSKLAAAGSAIACGNTAYHIYKAGKSFKSGHKLGQDPRYQERLSKELEKDNREYDRELKKLEKAEAVVKTQRKTLGFS
jgi:uncharacterized membrane protein YebE (DUF533 family)